MDDNFILSIILRARDEMSTTLARAKAELRAFTDEGDRLERRADTLNRRLDTLNRRLDTFARRGDAIKQTLGVAGTAADDFEKKVAKSVASQKEEEAETRRLSKAMADQAKVLTEVARLRQEAADTETKLLEVRRQMADDRASRIREAEQEADAIRESARAQAELEAQKIKTAGAEEALAIARERADRAAAIVAQAEAEALERRSAALARDTAETDKNTQSKRRNAAADDKEDPFRHVGRAGETRKQRRARERAEAKSAEFDKIVSSVLETQGFQPSDGSMDRSDAIRYVQKEIERLSELHARAGDEAEKASGKQRDLARAIHAAIGRERRQLIELRKQLKLSEEATVTLSRATLENAKADGEAAESARKRSEAEKKKQTILKRSSDEEIAADRAKKRANMEKRLGRPVSDEEFNRAFPPPRISSDVKITQLRKPDPEPAGPIRKVEEAADKSADAIDKHSTAVEAGAKESESSAKTFRSATEIMADATRKQREMREKGKDKSLARIILEEIFRGEFGLSGRDLGRIKGARTQHGSDAAAIQLGVGGMRSAQQHRSYLESLGLEFVGGGALRPFDVSAIQRAIGNAHESIETEAAEVAKSADTTKELTEAREESKAVTKELTKDQKKAADMDRRFTAAVAERLTELGGVYTPEGAAFARAFKEGDVTMENLVLGGKPVFSKRELNWLHKYEESFMRQADANVEATEATKESTKATKESAKSKGKLTEIEKDAQKASRLQADASKALAELQDEIASGGFEEFGGEDDDVSGYISRQDDYDIGDRYADDDVSFGGFGGMGGGAPSKRDIDRQEALKRLREAESRRLTDIEVQFTELSKAAMSWWMKMRGEGALSEKEWIARLEGAEKQMQTLARRLSRLTTVDDKHLRNVLSHIDNIRERIALVQQETNESIRRYLTQTPLGISGAKALEMAREKAFDRGEYDPYADEEGVIRKSAESFRELSDAEAKADKEATRLHNSLRLIHRQLETDEIDRKDAIADFDNISRKLTSLMRGKGVEVGGETYRAIALMAKDARDARDALSEVTEETEGVKTETRDLVKEYDNYLDRVKRGEESLSRQRILLAAYRRQLDAAASRQLRDSGPEDEQYLRIAIAAQDAGDQIQILNKRIRESEETTRETDRGWGSWAHRIRRANHEMMKAGQSIAAIDNQMRGMIVLAVMVFGQQIITALVSLAGALSAVASSAVEAGAALGGALAAGAMQAIPGIGLLIASLAKLKDVMDADQQLQLVQQQLFQRQDDAAKKLADTSDAVANAQEGLAAAEDRLAEAHDNVGEAQQRLTRARRDARDEIQRLIQAERDAELAARGAAISQKEAQDRLRATVASGDISALAGDELGVLEAAQARRKAASAWDEARRERSRAERPGAVDRMDSVRQARKALDDARKSADDAAKAVEKAQRGVERAGRNATAAVDDNFAALEKLQFLLAQLTPAQLRLYGAVQLLRGAYKENLEPIVDILVDEFADGALELERLMSDERLLGPLRGLATGIADQMERIREEFTSNEFIEQMGRIWADGEQNLEPLADIIISLGKAWANIAEDAGPALNTILEYLSDLAAEFERLTDNDNTAFFNEAAEHFTAWMDMIVALINLIAAFTGAASGEGLRAVEGLTDWLNRTAESVRANSDDIAAFMSDAMEVTKVILNLVGEIGKALLEAFDPDNLEALASFIEKVLLPSLVLAIQFIGSLTEILGIIADNPALRALAQAFVFLTLFSRVWVGMRALFTTFGSQILTLFLPVAGVLDRVVKNLDNIAKKLPALSRALGAIGLGGLIAGAASRRRGGGGGSGVAAGIAAGGFIDYATVGTGDRGDGTPRKRKGLFGRLFGSADDLADEAADAGKKAGGKFSGFFNTGVGGLLKKAGWIGLGLSAVGGITSAFKYGSIGAGVRDVVSSITFGIVDSTEEKMTKALDRMNKAFESRDIGEMPDPFQRKEIPMQYVTGPSGQKIPDPEATQLLREAEDTRSEFEKWVSDLPKKLREPAERIGDIWLEMEDAVKDLDNVKLSSLKDELRAITDEFPDLGRAAHTTAEEITSAMRKVEQQLAPQRISWDLGRRLQLDPKRWRSIVDDALKEIKKLPPDLQKQAMRSMKFMADGLEANGDLPKGMAKQVAERAGDQWEEYRKKQDKHTNEALKNLALNFSAMMNVVNVSTGGMIERANSILKALGVGPVKDVPSAGKAVAQIINLGRTLVGGAAEGGIIGQQGMRGKDRRLYALGDGEAVLTGWHQKYIAPAVEHFYGHPFSETFRRVRGFHAGNKGDQFGFAVGREGAASMFDGHPSNVNDAVRRIIEVLKRRFPGLMVTSTTDHSKYTTSGNISDHGLGAAVDLSGPVALMNRVARYVLQSGMAKRLKQAIYSGNPALTFSGGRNVGAGYFGPAVMAQHANHLHLAAVGALGRIADAVSRLSRRSFDWPYTGAMKSAGQAILDRVRRGANRRIRDEEMGLLDDHSYAGQPTGKGALSRAAVSRVIGRAMEIVGVPRSIRSAWRSMAIDRAWQESSFNPNAVNNWDSNAQMGDPSRGLFQTISATFRAYAARGMGNILNPLHNTVAAFRYMLSRYGSGDWTRALSAMLGRRGVGYAEGGEIPGPIGAPRMVLAHAKEWILNPLQQSRIAQLVGTSVGNLKGMLGFWGSNEAGFQGGGEIADDEERLNRMYSSRRERERIRRLRQGIYRMTVMPLRDWEDVVREGNRAARALRAGSKGWRRFFNTTAAIAGEGGLLEAMERERTRLNDRMTMMLKKATFKFRKIGGELVAYRGLDEAEVAAREVENARKSLEMVVDQRGVIQTSLRKVNARLRRLARDGISEAEAKQARHLRTTQQNLRNALDEINIAYTDGIETLFNAQVAAVQAEIDKITNESQRLTGVLDLFGRVAEALGNSAWAFQINVAKMEETKSLIAKLEGQLASAIATGDQNLVNSLTAQIGDLKAQIVEMSAKLLGDMIAAVDKVADDRQWFIGLEQRAADLMERRGDVIGANQQRISNAQQTTATLQEQLAGYGFLYSVAQAQGNVGQMEALQKKMAELTIAIEESEQTTRELIVQTHSLSLSMVTANANTATTLIGGAQSIIEKLGNIAGQVDPAKILPFLQLIAATLATAAQNIVAEVNSVLNDPENPLGTAANAMLLGLRDAFEAGPEAFATFLANNAGAIADIMQQLGPDTPAGQLFQALIDSMLNNTTAVVDNTAQIEELNGGSELQSWSSSGWELFREAIFNGLGGLATDYQLAAGMASGAASGSQMYSGGAPGVSTGGGDFYEGDTHVHITEPKEVLDVNYTAQRIAHAKRTRGR